MKADFQKEGYNQTYFILNPPPTSVITVIREVFFRFGNWCYHGAINVGFPQLKESTIPGLLPLLHKQQSNLHSTCQYDKLPPESKFKPLLHTFEKAARFIEVALETADEKLLKVAGDDKWVDDDWEDAFFQFETTEHHYPGVDCVINKSYSKGILLHILYIQNSYFAVLTQAADNIPLLDTLFPDISKRLQCQHNYIVYLLLYLCIIVLFYSLKHSLQKQDLKTSNYGLVDKGKNLHLQPKKQQPLSQL